MKFDKIIGFIQIGLPPLLSFIKGLFSRKTYTSDEIHEKSKREIETLDDWKDQSDEEYRDTLGKEP